LESGTDLFELLWNWIRNKHLSIPPKLSERLHEKVRSIQYYGYTNTVLFPHAEGASLYCLGHSRIQLEKC